MRNTLLAILLVLFLLTLALPLPAPAAEVDLSYLVPEVIQQEGGTCAYAALANLINTELARLGVDVKNDPGKRVSYQELVKLDELGWFMFGGTRVFASADRSVLVDLGDAMGVEISTLNELSSMLQKRHPVYLIILGSRDRNFMFHYSNPDKYCDPVTRAEGRHAVVAVGFSNTRQAVRILNSWGEGWGDKGYGWLSYRYINELLKHEPARAYPDIKLGDSSQYIIPAGFLTDSPGDRLGYAALAEVKPGNKKIRLLWRGTEIGGLAYWDVVELDVASVLKDGRIYVPNCFLSKLNPDPLGGGWITEKRILSLREAAQKIGMSVVWDAERKVAKLFKPGETG